MDACFDEDDEDECEAFEEASERLWDKIKKADRLFTHNVRMVESENRKLKRQIEKKEAAMKEEIQKIKEELGRHSNKHYFLKTLQ